MAVTRIDYIHGRNCRTIGTMISMIWGIAIIVSLAPLFGWRDPDFEDNVNNKKMCIVSQELSYQLFATLTTFYVPLVIILLLYWRIFMTARTRLRKRLAAKAKVALPVAAKKANNPAQGDTATSASPAIATNATSTNDTHRKESLPKKHSVVVEQNTSGGQPTTRIEIEATAGQQGSPGNGLQPQTASEAVEADDETKAMLPPARFVSQGCQTDRSMSNHNHFDEKNNSSRNNSSSDQLQQLQQQPAPPSGQPQNNGSGGGQQAASASVKKHVSLEAKRERKAAKTLAIVTGAFIACWLPFFVLALFMAIFGVQHFNPTLVSSLLWLGYFNSTLNPIIYTIFSPEFRTAFKRILCGKSHVLNHRPRHLQ